MLTLQCHLVREETHYIDLTQHADLIDANRVDVLNVLKKDKEVSNHKSPYLSPSPSPPLTMDNSRRLAINTNIEQDT